MPLFHKNLFKILVSRVESRNERQNLSKCFRFVCVLRDENCNSAKISSTRSWGQPCSIRRIRENSFFFNSTNFLTEFVLSKHSASPFTKLFITLRSAAFLPLQRCLCPNQPPYSKTWLIRLILVNLSEKLVKFFHLHYPIKLAQDKDRIEKAMHDSETVITYPLLGSTEIPTGERAFCVTRVFLELPSSLATSILS